MSADRRARPVALIAVVALFVALLAGALAGDPGLDLPVEKPEPRAPATPPGVATPATKPPTPPDPPVVVQAEAERLPTIYGGEVRAEGASLVYVLDISGSMGLDLAVSPDATGALRYSDRLDRAKAELEKSIASLPPSWRFDVVAYDCDPRVWSATPREATAANRAEAVAWARALRPQGATGTGLAVGTALALDRANRLVLLLTDGGPNCHSVTMNGNVPPEVHRADIRAANVQRARIDVFGIACPSGSPFEQFCRAVAADNGGTYTGVR